VHQHAHRESLSGNFYCHFRKLLFCAILCVSIASSLANYEDLSLECLKKYLKDRNVNEEILEYVNPYVGSLIDCQSAVKTAVADIHSNLRNNLNGNRKNRPFVECTMRDIEEEDDESYELIRLRETAVAMVSNWRFWKYFSKKSRSEELSSSANSIVDKSLLKCKGHREFGDLFNNIFEGTVKWNRTGEQQYCIRRVLVEKQLLNENIYNFRDNPKNVRTENLDCQEIVTKVTDGLYDEVASSRKISGCALDAFRKNNYADYILKTEVLSRLSLLAADKSKERQNFINVLVDITYEANKC